MNDILISCALDIGEQMLQSGGEVSRVEDTIARILRAYGFQKVDVFTITSEIQVTATDSQGGVCSQIRRIHTWGTNLEKLERLNQLSRDICKETPGMDELRGSIEKECTSETGKGRSEIVTDYLGGALAAGGFAVFFGGRVIDGILAALLACVIVFMNRRGHAKAENQLLYYFFFALITGIAGSVVTMLGRRIGLVIDLDKILIGCVMLTIPGISITYSVRDMLMGETITGLLRFVESVLVAASIAAGFTIATLIVGGVR